jgi:glycosyltransferase involved in cell wall biosynthesis
MGDQEGIDILLQSVAHIIHKLQRHDIQFCLIGGGPSLAHYEQEAIHLNVADFVTFAGRTSDEALLEILSTADVCVNPDRVTSFSDKSTMIKIMEYMALAKPIVQFDVTEGRFTAEAASLYARPNDPVDMARQILRLLDSPELRSEMGNIGRARIEATLSWDHQIPNLIAAHMRASAMPESTAFANRLHH